MNKKDEALKLALEALKQIDEAMPFPVAKFAQSVIREALADHIRDATKMIEQPAQPKINCKHRRENNGVCPHHNLHCGWPKCNEPEQPVQQQEQKLEFVSPGGGYVPAIPRPMPLDWKLVPREATPEMLKAMDDCAQEGYDERLYAGMASSVYMAAWDASPVMGTLPEQPAQQQAPAAKIVESRPIDAKGNTVKAAFLIDKTLPDGTLLYAEPLAKQGGPKPIENTAATRMDAGFVGGPKQPAQQQEPLAWGIFHFGGKRDRKLYTTCDTREQAIAYIADRHQSDDTNTFRAAPIYTSPQPSKPWVELTTAEFDEIHERSATRLDAMCNTIAKLQEKNA